MSFHFGLFLGTNVQIQGCFCFELYFFSQINLTLKQKRTLTVTLICAETPSRLWRLEAGEFVWGVWSH